MNHFFLTSLNKCCTEGEKNRIRKETTLWTEVNMCETCYEVLNMCDILCDVVDVAAMIHWYYVYLGQFVRPWTVEGSEA